MLEIYQQLLASTTDQNQVAADDSTAQIELRLSGLVVQKGGELRITNRLYATVFNQHWVEQVLRQLASELT